MKIANAGILVKGLNRRVIFATCAVLFVLSQTLFLINIQFPRGQNFDEFHYVPSAKQFLHLQENQNTEHPPLGKELMAIGIGIWGDRPIGWRFMSTVFGALTLVGMYLWALALFRDQKIAIWAALLTLVNQLLYVQARIGMLDTFMFAFIAWAMAAFTATWQTTSPKPPSRKNKLPVPEENPPFQLNLRDTRRLLGFAGVCLGLATSCKWYGVIPWALCGGSVLLVRMLQSWRIRFDSPGEDDWFSPTLWSGIRKRDWIVCLGILPLVGYYIPFIPFFFLQGKSYGLFQILFTMQYDMWDAQGRVVNSHPYMSNWKQWATLARPIWYAFDKEGANNELVRGVVLLGNPWVMWTGLIAVVGCLWSFFTERRRDAFLISATYIAFYFSWAVIPRKIAFFYYYYPAGMVLSLAIAFIFFHGEKEFRWKFNWGRWVFFAVALGFFVYFFPISAALQIPAETFRKWMWRASWI